MTGEIEVEFATMAGTVRTARSRRPARWLWRHRDVIVFSSPARDLVEESRSRVTWPCPWLVRTSTIVF